MSRTSRTTKPTPAANKHVFEPFSRRIARLKIDPVHTIKGRTALDDASDLSHSYFRVALDEWASLNLTVTFTSFLRGVNGLSESLPQLIHHADKVFDLLVEHIVRRDALALEPLLDLTAHFAHDLGQEFEKYFERIVCLVADVAANTEAPEVVEWSFTCLAWMFKYLARLLVRDLRPLLRIFRPYLTARKEHVSRFSAESLAFLIRKAAIMYPKKRAPLDLAMAELLTNVTKDAQSQQGVMALLVESCLGVDMQLHSGAEFLVQCMLQTVKTQGTEEAQSVAVGVLTGMVHDTDSSSFNTVVAKVLDSAKAGLVKGDIGELQLSVVVLQTIVGSRKGTRISDWKNVLSVFIEILENSRLKAHSEIRQTSLLTSALMLQYASMDQLLPLAKALLDATIKDLPATDFFSFCTIVADLGRDRFQQFLLPQLQDFIRRHYSDDEAGLLFTLEQLRERRAIGPEKLQPGFTESSKDWNVSLSRRLAQRTNDNGLSEALLVGFCRLPRSIHISGDCEAGSKIVYAMRDRIVAELESNRLKSSFSSRISLGWLLESFVGLNKDMADLDTLWSKLTEVPSCCWTLLPFLRAINALSSQMEKSSAPTTFQDSRLAAMLISNMLLQDQEMRRESLILLKRTGAQKGGSWIIEATDGLLEILGTPYLPSNARTISMLLRRLPQLQKACPQDTVLETLIPKFCVGMLSLYHDQARKDLCRSLGEMIEGTALEDTLMEILVSWLSAPSGVAAPATKAAPLLKSSTFEDMSLIQGQDLAQTIFRLFEDPAARLIEIADQDHRLHMVRSPVKGRTLALSALLEMATIAEKRSRFITPVFLSAQFTRTVLDAGELSESSGSSHTLSPDFHDGDWALSERRAFVTLLAHFQNPKVLFRSSEVYQKLLDLLTNGNVDIRKQALLAILKWKDPVLQKHETLLLRIIDEKIPSTDIGVVLNAESEENPIKPDERQAVLQILLRLIYGLLVGRSGSYGSQEARRKSLLRMLFRMHPSEIATYLDIAVGKLREVKLLIDGQLAADVLRHDITTPDQRYGFLRMMLSMLQTLQSAFAPFGRYIIEPVLYCTMRASLLIESSTDGSNSLERNIRRTGLECLNTMFENAVDVAWSSYMPFIFSQLLVPRLETFASENTQAASILLRLISRWCSSDQCVSFLTIYDDRLLPSLWEILAARVTKAEVKIFILNDILSPLLQISDTGPLYSSSAYSLIQSHQSAIEQGLAAILESAPPAELLKSVTTTLLQFAPLSAAEYGSENIVRLLVGLMSTSKHRLTPAIKSGILKAIDALLKARAGVLGAGMADELYKSTSALFDYFKDYSNRLVLCEILQTMGGTNATIKIAAEICLDLNSMSSDRLDEVDYDRRLPAFQKLPTLSMESKLLFVWRPILHNLLFFSRDEDFNIRSSAVSSLRGFIKRVSGQSQDDTEMLKEIVLPAVQKGLVHESEVVRADFVSLFGLLVEHSNDPRLDNMKPLLVGSDEEASFFTNILHIQQHRRLRAIRRLVAEVEKNTISAANVSQVFLPLLQRFVRDQSMDESAQGTKGQSLAAMTTLLQWVEWKQFKPIFKQYKTDLGNEELQRTAIKMLGHASDALLHASKDRAASSSDGHEAEVSHLARTIPAGAGLADQVKDQLLPKLADFVHFKDEAEISSRLPAATIAVKLIRLLPTDEGHILSAPIVLDVANVLRSRAQESRDAGRGVLNDIVRLLGPESIQFVLRQLRTVLQRGYQLHVLSYTLHAILVKMAPTLQVSELDYCVDDLVSVIMDDTFGNVGQEKDNEDYISSMKEVKSKKSFDTMELIARCMSLDHLGRLIHPVTVLLSGSLNVKQIRQVDEMLRRVGVGLSGNPAASERGLLVFAYQTIQAFYKEKAKPSPAAKTNDEKNRERFLLQKSTPRTNGTSSTLLFKIARFAIDLVRSALVKHSHLLNPENVHGFLPVIGDALVEGQEDVKISALRLLSAIVKLRMPELDENCPLYVMEAVKVVKNCTNTNEEIAQAALKLVAAVLRERKSVKVRDSDISEVLRRITPDLEEPDRQGVTFNFIRAVLARKYQLPEVYEIVDKIAVMMVTSQAHGARDVARGVYVHFLVEYPQASNRWTKQQRFLIKNLEYDYFEGRQAVMEAINTLLGKTSGETTQQLISAFFIPIVLRMANDEHAGCSELASALLGQLLMKADEARLKGMLEPLEGWLGQDDNNGLLRIGLQAFAVLLTVRDSSIEEQVVLCRARIGKILASITVEGSSDTRIQALRLLAVLVNNQPLSVMTTKSDTIWKQVRGLLRTNTPERTIAAALVQSFLQNCNSEAWAKLPLANPHGLRWDATAVQDLLRSCVRIIKLNQGDTELSNEVLPIISQISHSAHVNGLTVPTKSEDDPAMSSDDEELDIRPSSSSIPATQYLLDQLAYILRRELPKHTTATLFPKTTSLQLLTTLIPTLPAAALPHAQLSRLLLPLLHLTSTDSSIPFSADPTFSSAYEALTTNAQEVMSLIQDKVGDEAYIKAMTAASKVAKERREERRRKRVLEQVADPERAARYKKVKGDRKRERKREVGMAYRGRRRGGGAGA